MTTPDDNPSFLARLAILATIGAILTQIANGVFLAVVVDLADTTAPLSPRNAKDTLINVLIVPAIIYLGTAGIYYLFKGRPKGVDSRIASGLYYTWGISLFVGGWVSAWLGSLM